MKITPRQGAVVETPAGRGTVEYVSLLKGLLKVRIDSEKETALQEFPVDQVKIIKNNNRDRERNKNREEI